MAESLQKFSETTAVRLLVEEVMQPLIKRYFPPQVLTVHGRNEQFNTRLTQFESALHTDLRKFEEINVFLRRLSLAQNAIDSLFGRVTELVSN